jgi:hypothetical protein
VSASFHVTDICAFFEGNGYIDNIPNLDCTFYITYTGEIGKGWIDSTPEADYYAELFTLDDVMLRHTLPRLGEVNYPYCYFYFLLLC